MRHNRIPYLRRYRYFDLPFSQGLCTNLRLWLAQDEAFALCRRGAWEHRRFRVPGCVRACVRERAPAFADAAPTGLQGH